MKYLKTKRLLTSVLFLLLFLVGCSSNPKSNSVYEKIDAKAAKEIIAENPNAIILDVRTQEEYNEKHIKDAILIPDYEISSKANELLPDKDALILVYCRSGNRSKGAAEALVKLGYTNVYEFGGINSWPYEVVTF